MQRGCDERAGATDLCKLPEVFQVSHRSTCQHCAFRDRLLNSLQHRQIGPCGTADSCQIENDDIRGACSNGPLGKRLRRVTAERAERRAVAQVEAEQHIPPGDAANFG